ncbi:kinase-like protein [Gonapodya prolifera JEL478]|uniref:Kinase-like protein n=1 Tax=Gonapodya prolifera (strain JEL478) TaxID=1344416 RepID=A0A139AE49_GONPJ|nr:kinase-like protein [Gonapodya prolifera JEL478]|eukprot:KXS15071.1 kinase-like protein [Gonapodya prolifera JEL478]
MSPARTRARAHSMATAGASIPMQTHQHSLSSGSLPQLPGLPPAPALSFDSLTQFPGQQHSSITQPSSFARRASATLPYLSPQLHSVSIPSQRGFRRVTHQGDLLQRPSLQHPPRKISVVKSLTRNLLAVYHTVNPAFQYQSDNNPRRVLTKPSKPAHNDGYDNEDGDYILYVNDTLGTSEGQQYLILDVLGQGTFGQVVKCQNVKTKDLVAVKVIKNKPAYYNQSLVEVAILEMLNSQYDTHDRHHLVRMLDTFVHRSHLCIVFEMLSVNLYELIKQNGFRGLSTNLVRVFVAQILDALSVLNRARIIHCDLKPENILLKNLESPSIKVIDYGSACHENQTVYTYIQSRFYRSPEVLVGLPYTSSIDMWSLGCIAAELFLGLPLFPGSSEYNQVARIVEMLGVPPAYMLEKGKQSHNFFEKRYGPDGRATYRLKSMETYMRETGYAEQPSKRYFSGTTLEEVVGNYPVTRKGLSQKELEKEMQNRQSFVDFLRGLLNLNPLERWSPQQARSHPFVTGEKFTGPYVPQSRRATAVSSSGTSSNPSAAALVGEGSTSHHHRSSQRPRANTISSSTMDRHNVPPQLQRLVELSSGGAAASGRTYGRTRGGGATIAGGHGAQDVPAAYTPASSSESSVSGIEVEVVGENDRVLDMMDLSETPAAGTDGEYGSEGEANASTGRSRNHLGSDLMLMGRVASGSSNTDSAEPYFGLSPENDQSDPDTDPSDAMETRDEGGLVEAAPGVLMSLVDSDRTMEDQTGIGAHAFVPSAGHEIVTSAPGASQTRTFSDVSGSNGPPSHLGKMDSGWTTAGAGSTRFGPIEGPSNEGTGFSVGTFDHMVVPAEEMYVKGQVEGLHAHMSEGPFISGNFNGDIVQTVADVAVAVPVDVPTIHDLENLKSPLSSNTAAETVEMDIAPPAVPASSDIAPSVEPSAAPSSSSTGISQPGTSQSQTNSVSSRGSTVSNHNGSMVGFRYRVANADSAYVDYSYDDDDEGPMTPGVASSLGTDSGVSLSPRNSNIDSPLVPRENMGGRIQQGRRHTLPSVTRSTHLSDRRIGPGGQGADVQSEPRVVGRRRSVAPEYSPGGPLQSKRRLGGL